jgi:hypothetical protein
MYKPPKKLKLDIIVSGYDEDKESIIKPVIETLQKQMDKLDRTDIGVMFGLGNKKDNNLAEVQNNVLSQSLNTEYYVMLDCTDKILIMPNYISRLLKIIEQNEGTENQNEVLTLNGINKCE